MSVVFDNVRVGIINVPVKVGADAWERCFRTAAENSPIFGVNETILNAQKNLYRMLARQEGFGFFGLNGSPNPVFWNKEQYRRVSGEVHRLHVRGNSVLAKRFPGFNDQRFATELVLDPRDGGAQIAVICTHWVPEGKKVSAPWRAWARAESKKAVRKIAKRHLREGRVVFIIGDTNIHGVFNFGIRGFRFQWIEGVRIDKVGVWLPAGVALRNFNARTYKAPTDHGHGIAAFVNLLIRKDSA